MIAATLLGIFLIIVAKYGLSNYDRLGRFGARDLVGGLGGILILAGWLLHLA